MTAPRSRASARSVAASTAAAAPCGTRRSRRNPSACDRIRPDEAGTARRHDDACTHAAEPLELPERGDDLLERREPVAEARRVLEALVAREAPEPRAERHDGRLDVVRLVAVERPRGTAGDALRR